MSMLSLGAINKTTGEYVYPKIANKKDNYICPDCNKDLILCQGEIRIPYFRHKVDTINPCNHYNNPSESQIHKDAKLLLKYLLEKKTTLTFERKCVECKHNEEFEIPEITDTSIIQLEHRFEYGGLKIADVAYLDDNEIFCIFEICNTHKTCSEDRPEPWFEINAEELIRMANNNDFTSLKIPCMRCEKCKNCIYNEYKKYKFSFVTNIGSLYNLNFQEKNNNNVMISNQCNMVLGVVNYYNLEDNMIIPRERDSQLMDIVCVNCIKNFNEDEIKIINKYNINNLDDFIRKIGSDKSILLAFKELNEKKEKIINYSQIHKMHFIYNLNMLSTSLIVKFDIYLFRIRISVDKTIKYIESYGLINEHNEHNKFNIELVCADNKLFVSY
jgi:hypothetical protein